MVDITADIQQIRNNFPILSTKMNGKPLVFLDSGASSQKPLQVIEAIADYYKNYHANVHRGVYQLSQVATDKFEQARNAVKHFINAASEREIIFTGGTTESINLVASCFGRAFLHEGDEVVITEMEHHSNIVPWQMICEERKAKLKVVPFDENGVLKLEEFEKLLSSKVKIVALTHISNSLGTINPVKEIIEIAHRNNIPVLLDGAQAIPHLNIDVQELDVDFYAFSSHKMYGPTGVGILYGKGKWLDAMPPYRGGGEMIKTVTFEKTEYNELPFKFEAGTPNIAGAVGLHAAIDYLNKLGTKYIAAHEEDLLAYGTDALLSIDGLRLIGTSPKKAGILSFVVEGCHPYDIGAILDKMGIAVRTGHHCTQPLMAKFGIPGTVRASFGIYNNFEDIDRLVDGVKKAVTLLK